MSTNTVGRPLIDAAGPLEHVNIRVPVKILDWAKAESQASGRPLSVVLRGVLLVGFGVIEDAA